MRAYKVNDIVRFNLKVEKLGTGSNDSRYFVVWIKMGDGSWERVCNLRENATLVQSKARHSGDTKLLLFAKSDPSTPPKNEQDGIELFYEDVVSLNRYLVTFSGWVIAIILAIFEIIANHFFGIVK